MFALYEHKTSPDSVFYQKGVYKYFMIPTVQYIEKYGAGLLDILEKSGLSYGSTNKFAFVELSVNLTNKYIVINYFDNYASKYFHALENIVGSLYFEQKELFVGLGKRMLKMAIDDISAKYSVNFLELHIDCAKGSMPNRDTEGLLAYYLKLGFVKKENILVAPIKEIFKN